MSRFQRLELKCLSEPINRKYMEVLGKFSAEIDRIQKVNCNISYKYSTNNVLSVLLPVSALPGAMPGSSSWLQHASNEWEDCMVEAAVPAH